MEEIGMKKRMIIICGGTVVTLVIIVPILIDYCILGNGISSNIGNDVWMAFFGSCFGGLFGAIATLMVLYDTQNSRRKLEEKSKKERDEERKLSIKPCLQVREQVLGSIEQLYSGNNVYYIFYEHGLVKQKRYMTKELKNHFSYYYIIETELKNVGMGSAISLNAYIDEKQFLFNDSLEVGQILRLYYILNTEELFHKEFKVTFRDSDIMGLMKYEQQEKFLIYLDGDEFLKEYKQYLTLPQNIE